MIICDKDNIATTDGSVDQYDACGTDRTTHKTYNIEDDIKWPTFCSLYFQMWFHEWKSICIDSNFTVFCA